MFVQVIQGRCADRERLRAALERWRAELGPTAEGWLGSTAGVTQDGKAIAFARFESAAAAERNSERPEQGAWWSETAAAFSGDVTFHNSDWVDVETPGDPDEAGFVQVIQGRGSDPDRARQIMSEDGDAWAEYRPDVLGNLTVGHDGDGYTTVIYFSSEEAARAGERKEMPPELAAKMAEVGSLSIGDPTFYDLSDPWLASPS